MQGRPTTFKPPKLYCKILMSIVEVSYISYIEAFKAKITHS